MTGPARGDRDPQHFYRARRRARIERRLAAEAMPDGSDKARRWYGSRRWKAKRLAQLRAEPLCAFCLREGKITPATVADHVTPHKGDEGLFWSGELQSLCAHHHNRDKQVIERGGTVRRYGEDGWPIEG